MYFSYVVFISQLYYDFKYWWTIFLVFSLYFFWHAHALISGVRRTKHVLPNERSVMASNSLHRQCLQLQPSAEYAGLSSIKTRKKSLCSYHHAAILDFFGVNTARKILNGRRSTSARDRATYFCFVSWDSKILMVWTHQKFWRGPIKLDLWEQLSICVPGTHYKFKSAFFGKHFA